MCRLGTSPPPPSKRSGAKRICIWMASLYWDLWSNELSWTGAGFGCSLPSVAGNVMVRRLQTPAALKIRWITAVGIILPVLWFLLSWWNWLCYVKSPDCQMWKSSAYRPLLQSPLSGLLP